MAALPALAPMTEAYAAPCRAGFNVIPIRAGDKVPATQWRNYQSRHSTTDEIGRWAVQPGNIGIVTGAISGIVVLDLDSPEAIAEAEQRGLPDTVAVRTGKGRHVYFAHPGGVVGNRTAIFPGADIRGDGGYVVAPGSTHPNGSAYLWQAHPDVVDLAPLPDWLADMLGGPTAPAANNDAPMDKQSSAYVQAAIDGEFSALRRAPEGQRNDALNRAAFALGQFSTYLDAPSTKRMLEATAIAIGLDASEVATTLESGWAAGEQEPREVPQARTEEASQTAEGLVAAKGITAAELLAMEFPPIQWVVPGFITEGLTLLAGAPKIGKSWLALGLGMAVAEGGKAFGEIDCEPGRVLYLALEDNHRRLASRLRHMGWRAGPEGLDLMTTWPSLDDDCVHQLELWADQHPDARMVVVDVFAKIKSAKGGNRPQYETDYKDVTALQRFALDRGLAVILVHHTRKQQDSDDPFDAVSGTRGLTGSADSTFVLDRGMGQAGPALYGRGRDIEEIEKSMAFDPTTCRWTMAGPIVELQASPERQEILKVLRDADQPMALGAIAEAVQRSASNVSNMLGKMIRNGSVRKVSTGLYEIASPAVRPWSTS